MERKIGEIFEYNGEWYQCVKSDGTCNGCVGKFQSYSFCNGFGECVGKIFKKLEKVGEPYVSYCKLRQRYKLSIPLTLTNGILDEDISCDEVENIIDIAIKQNKEDMEENNAKHSNSESNRGRPEGFDHHQDRVGGMTMENLVISASRVEIDTETDRTILVDIQMSTAEYESVLGQYREEDVVRIVGARELLEHMDYDDIISYVNDTGIMETQEDRQ